MCYNYSRIVSRKSDDMKKRKLNKKSIAILSIILLIIIIELVNPIKLYNKHLLRELNYSETSIDVILDNNLKKEILKQEYSKALDIILASKDYQNKNFSIYQELNYVEISDYVKNINSLIEKGYQSKDINNIIKSGSSDDIKTFLEKDYDKDVSKFLQYDFAKLKNYDRYLSYKENNNIEDELVVVYVNIGLDKDYYTDYNEVNTFSTEMLVNKYNGLTKDFVPNDLVQVDSTYAVDKKQKANKEMLENFMKMSDDCQTNVGYKLLIRSAYRDYQSQEDTYNLYLKTYGKNYAESYAAHAGFSEHQTGLAADIKAESNNVFAGTKESKWLSENAHKYGFILRYGKDNTEITGYKYESWHYRYVGVEIATYVYENEMTFDEYYIRFLDK